MADSKTGEGKIAWNTLCKKVKKCAKNDDDIANGYRSQLEGAPPGQIWDILSSNLIMVINNYNQWNEIRIWKSTLL